MNKIQIAKKYGRALINTFDVSAIAGIIEGIEVFSRLIHAHREFKHLFASRIFSDEEKELALKPLISYLQLTQQTEKFLKLIIIQGHLSALPEIVQASINAYNERLKKVTALVISPVTLEKIYVDRLRNVLKNLTRRDVDIENQIDTSLLGGFIVKVGSTVYDNSLKGQFSLLRSELTKNIAMN